MVVVFRVFFCFVGSGKTLFVFASSAAIQPWNGLNKEEQKRRRRNQRPLSIDPSSSLCSLFCLFLCQVRNRRTGHADEELPLQLHVLSIFSPEQFILSSIQKENYLFFLPFGKQHRPTNEK